MADQGEWPVELPVDTAFTFGQVQVNPLSSGGFTLCHREEADVTAPELFNGPQAAFEIARTDDHGSYRPLKTAPNLRHGWQLNVGSPMELETALNNFYPGRLAIVKARNEGSLQPTALRDTLGRQTGMYRIAANISDAQLDCLIADFCRSDSGCLRTILWRRDANDTIPSSMLPPEKFDPAYDQALSGGAEPGIGPNVPLLCQEACNLLVAECRKVLKGERQSCS